MTHEEHIALYKECFCNDPEALRCALDLGKAFRIWDDTWDDDRVHTKEEFDDVFSSLSFDLERNEFYKEHRQVIQAFIFISWNAWQDSNAWQESEDKKEKECAWHIREFCNELVVLFAWLVGGKKHARNISLKVRRKFLDELIQSES